MPRQCGGSDAASDAALNPPKICNKNNRRQRQKQFRPGVEAGRSPPPSPQVRCSNGLGAIALLQNRNSSDLLAAPIGNFAVRKSKGGMQ
jgi:hypothetical protein